MTVQAKRKLACAAFDADRKRIMRDNLAGLLGLPSA